MDWFKHDTDASADTKLTALRLACKGGGVDAYYVILETIYKEERAYDLVGNDTAMAVLAHKLGTSKPTLEKWVGKMVDLGLFHNDVENQGYGKGLFSDRCGEVLERFKAKQETARQNGKKPKSNQRRSNVAPTLRTEKIRIDKEKEKEKEKERQSVGAAAAGAAPPSCPACGARLFHASTGEDRCLSCGKVYR